MAIHWQVKFKSLRADELYTVSIYDDNYIGEPVQLTGAAEPFATDEDDTEDMFSPIRTQSGYLRIVDDGNVNWRDIIPTTDVDRPVVLTDSGGNVRWQGFMQAQNFGAELYGVPQEHEFPLQCPLTVTSMSKVDYMMTEMQNFAYLLWEIVTSIPVESRPVSIYVQGGSDAQAWLMKKIDWQNFVNIKKDGSTEANKNLYDCLESMCQYWGWTARTQGDNLYLTCVDDDTEPTFLLLSVQDLLYLANDVTAGTNVGTLSTVTFGSNIFASINNTDYQDRGPNKAVVSSDGNTADSAVIKTYPDDVLKTMFAGGSYTEIYTENELRAVITNDISNFTSALLLGSCVTDVSFNAMRVIEQGLTTNGQDYTAIRIKPSYNGNNLAYFRTTYEHNFYDSPISGFSSGGLYMYGDVIRKGKRYEFADDQGIGKSTIKFRVGIGKTRNSALWYNNTSRTWTNTQSEISVRVGNTDRRELMWNASTNNTNLQGYLYIDILGSDNMEHEASQGFIDRFDLVDFRVEFRRSVHVGISSLFDNFERVSSQEYDAFNGTMVDQEWSVKNSFATDKDFNFGYSVLSNPDGTLFTGHNYGGTITQPEQHLANRVVEYWSKSKRRLSCELIANVAPNITPLVKGTIDGTMMYPISISRDWRDDVVRVVLMELPADNN